MARYLVIESRDPFDSSDSAYLSELVRGIAARGNPTTLFLIQNGVLPARKGAKPGDALAALIRSKVEVLADDFSLKERAITQLVDGVKPADIGRLVDMLMEPGTKVIWH
ncbi:MAG TPA: DsrE family protein [candidate division Zixibacteria bacterium]|nr:DsrE family protein [candidate division Zixibacteria bacterium]